MRHIQDHAVVEYIETRRRGVNWLGVLVFILVLAACVAIL